MNEHKVVVLGSMGAGKSTLVRAVAAGVVVDTDVDITDASSDKPGTTVALDYADVALPDGDRLRLYGSPGQARFDFVWPVLLDGAVGVLVLVDAAAVDPLADLRGYLAAADTHAPGAAVVVAVTRIDLLASDIAPDVVTACTAHGSARGIPVVQADLRLPADALMLMDILASLVEARAMAAAHG